MVEFGVLGPLVVQDDHGRGIPVRGPVQRRALAVLLAHPNEVVAHSGMAEALWDANSRHDPAALYPVISRLRQALGDREPAGLIRTEPAGYVLRVEPRQLDSLRFLDLVRQARAVTGEAPDEALALFEEAAGLWRGRAFGEVADVPLIRSQASRWEELRLAVSQERAEILVNAGRFADALALLEPQVRDHVLRERPLALLMKALYGAGRHTEALDAFTAYRRALADELGLDPSPELLHLQERIIRHEIEPPSPRSTTTEPATAVSTAPARGAPSRTALPVATSTFVGRRGDLDAVAALLLRQRLVTLVGVGGVGKTRLAIEVARRTADRHHDGAVLVELATMTSVDQVLLTLAGPALVGPQSTADLRDAVLGGLAGRRSLLVLDNCEHMLDGVADLVADLLARSDTLTVLATSRERLRVAGETVRQVAPLPVTGEDDAVRLFVDRARLVSPAAVLEPDARPAIAELCARLDGLPLAIELAAARTSALTVAEIAAHLDERFHILSAGHRRTGDHRHGSLRSVVDWSYDLLDERRKDVFDQLSIFPGEFSLDAARGIAGGTSMPAGEFIQTLLELVECSLVQRTEVAGASRFHLLETVRRYGREHLAGKGRWDAAADRHADWFVQFAERADASRARMQDWYLPCERELPNLRAARQRLRDRGDVARLVRLSAALYYYAFYSLRTELFEWATDTAQLAEGGDHPQLAAVLGTVALGAWYEGDKQRAGQLARQGLAHAERHGNLGITAVIDMLGDIASSERRFHESARMHGWELELARELNDDFQIAMHAGCLSVALARAGELDAATRMAAEMSSITTRSTSVDLRAYTAIVEAEIALESGDTRSAREKYWEAVRISQDSGSTYTLSVAWMAAAKVATDYGDHRTSAGVYLAFLTHWPESTGDIPLAIGLRGVVELFTTVGLDRDAAVLVGGLPPAPTSSIFTGVSEHFANTVTALRVRIGDAEFEHAVSEGRRLSRQAVVARALAALRRVADDLGQATDGSASSARSGASSTASFR